MQGPCNQVCGGTSGIAQLHVPLSPASGVSVVARPPSSFLRPLSPLIESGLQLAFPQADAISMGREDGQKALQARGRGGRGQEGPRGAEQSLAVCPLQTGG